MGSPDLTPRTDGRIAINSAYDFTTNAERMDFEFNPDIF